MAQERDDIFHTLEQRITSWNAGAEDVSRELVRSLSEVMELFERIQQQTGSKYTLAVALVLARVKMLALSQTPEERSASIHQVMKQIDELEPKLASMHVELRTLLAQMKRTATAGDKFFQSLMSIQGEKSTLPSYRPSLVPMRNKAEHTTELEPSKQSPDTTEDVPNSIDTAYIRELETEIATLQSENVKLQEALSETRAQEEWHPISYRMPERPSGLVTQSKMLEKTAKELFRSLDEPGVTPYDRMKHLAHDAQGKKMPLGLILVQAGVITSQQLDEALQEQQHVWNRHLGDILVDMKLTSEEAISQAIAAQSKVPYIQLSETPIDERAVVLISSHLAHLHTCIPFQCDSNTASVAMANPLDLIALEDLEIATNRHVQLHVSPAQQIKEAIKQHYPPIRSAKPANW